MQINNLYNQLNFLKKETENKSILMFGPANLDFKKDTIERLFKKYDLIIINNKMVDLLEKIIKLSDYKIIHVLNGFYTKNSKDTIVRTQSDIFFYWVSEIHTFKEIEKYGVQLNKVMHMANNYKNFGFSCCPTMGPKMFMFMLFYKLNFSSLKVTGMTFYMDFQTVGQHYHSEYQDWKYFKEVYEKDPNYPELSYLKDKTVEELTEDDKNKLMYTEIKATTQGNIKGETAHDNIYQGWNMFLIFIN